VRDEKGGVVRRIDGESSQGIHRTTWDFRYPGFAPIDSKSEESYGPMAVPGTYNVGVYKLENGEVAELVAPVEFDVEPLGYSELTEAEREQVLAFQQKTGELQRAVMGADAAAAEADKRLDYIKDVIEKTPALPMDLQEVARDLKLRLTDLRERISGDPTKPKRSEPAMGGIMDRINQIVYGQWSTTSAPTETHRKNYEIAAEEFSGILGDLRQLIEVDLAALEDRLEAAGAPWTPGRGVPRWKR